MKPSLTELINKSQNGDEEALAQIISIFEPAIRRFSRELKYVEARTDLIITVIELVNEIDTRRLFIKSDAAVFNYIYNSLKNRKIDFHKKHRLNMSSNIEVNYDMIPDVRSHEGFDRILLKDALNTLSDLQKEIIYKIFIKGYSEKEIAGIYHISRQAVNRIKNRALRTLKRILA